MQQLMQMTMQHAWAAWTPFDILGHRERRPGAVLGPPDAGPMASARRTPPLGGYQVHCVPAHGGRERIVNPRRFPQTDRSSSVSQFRCLTVYPHQKTPHNMVCLLIFVLINKIGRPHQNYSMSFLSYSRGTLFRSVKLKNNFDRYKSALQLNTFK